MKTSVIRSAFLHYFKERGHRIVPSSSLLPGDDPTLLFTNAGMVQFKNGFLGEPLPYTRAASSQRCLRAGGKHNDLDNVGYTARHHTFFEMLGNFSFGDYFKREAIEFAWDFLTQVLGLPPDKLWVTVFETDQEAEDLWLKHIGVDPARFTRCGEADNFWAMGDTGPCGPCSEIYYDHGPSIAGGPPGSGDEGDRYVEIWNLVFMQYNRDANGQCLALPKPSVDTGMGLERIAAVMQGVHSNYQTDAFQPLIEAAAELSGTTDRANPSLQVLADHIRACAFLIADGVLPSNEGRGYVLRRIMRRAIRHGYHLGQPEPFLHQLLPTLTAVMGEAYPELVQKQAVIRDAIQQEEAQFSKTLSQGMRLLTQATAQMQGSVLAGDLAFKLYDTYGFPLDLTEDALKSQGRTVDRVGFERCMAQQRQRAREASQFLRVYPDRLNVTGETPFLGYEQEETSASVLALFNADQLPVTELASGDAGWVVLDKTTFYAEGGGQVGDQGRLHAPASLAEPMLAFEVHETRRLGETIVHQGLVETGTLRVGQILTATVERTHRRPTAANHSATHLLHATLRAVLGPQVLQKGSLVAPDRLRFDFAYAAPLTEAQLFEVERQVNACIHRNTPVRTQLMNLAQAKQKGAMALFGEKYAETVRVLEMGDNGFSVELCGGTHVSNTGDIGFFKIMAETGIAAGVRRIEALTGEAAVRYAQGLESRLNRIAAQFKVGPQEAEAKVNQALQKIKDLEKALADQEALRVQEKADALVAQLKSTSSGSQAYVLIAELENVAPGALRPLNLQIKERLKSHPFLLILGLRDKANGKALLSVLVNHGAQLSEQAFDARELITLASTILGGKGGGRADLAQLGSDKPENLGLALEKLKQRCTHLLIS